MTRLLLDSLNSLNRTTKVVRMTSRVVAVILGIALSHLPTHTQRLNVHMPLFPRLHLTPCFSKIQFRVFDALAHSFTLFPY